MNRRWIACTLVMLAASIGLAAASESWMHVRVEERGDGGERVSINVPLSMVEALLPSIESNGLHQGKVHISDHDIDGIDLREMLAALKDAPDAEFVTVRSDEENVRVAKEDGYLLVQADEDDERVRVKLPLDVVEAMLGVDGDELDLVAGLQRLADYQGGDLITVESDDETVRIWIDSSETGE